MMTTSERGRQDAREGTGLWDPALTMVNSGCSRQVVWKMAIESQSIQDSKGKGVGKAGRQQASGNPKSWRTGSLNNTLVRDDIVRGWLFGTSFYEWGKTCPF